METLGEYLDRIMRQKNLTPKKLARRCGLADGYIGRIRKGMASNLTVDTIAKLSQALGVNAHELFAVASGIPISETPQLDPLLLLDALQKLISAPTGFELVQQLLNFSPDERQRLLDYFEYFKRQPPKSKSTEKAKPRKKKN